MQLDLNLLTALDALLEEGSVMGAAQRLHLSSPAISRTLGRIRKLTGDEILVRTGRTMTPTPYALSVREQVRDLVRQAQAVLVPSRELDLDELDRTFTLQAHDALTLSLAPPLLNAVSAQAPHVRLRFLAEGAADTDDLRHGRVDLEIGADLPDRPEFGVETIGHDRLVVVMRRGHPRTGRMDLAAFAAQQHILVSRRGRLADPVDDFLAEHGLRRQVLAAVGTTASALHVISRSDCLMTAPEAMCRPLVDAFGLVTEPHPAAVPQPPVICTWHQRYDADPPHVWLRSQVRAALAAVLPSP
ncbi:LysR family transcriptional regulator [Kutzneria buriramensis]|uniref:DNA-binding transcriptional LysR family regulator n=1 Tax=Kutzneria buriramensis TaxID=1045776 RepID=A0A3E0HYK7_9PSEU|nr:LysR family transcriptional regulator [Kutzneria buriramensis]REH51554.1 DNA-binding transcriptional LysR family regulator [Kutzneria buriramensis]